MTRKEIEGFLLNRQGYLKKSPLKVAKAIWKGTSKTLLPKTREAVVKELSVIRDVQKNMRAATLLQTTTEDDFLMEAYDELLAYQNRPKRRLFFDIEVSANIVFSWRIGGDIVVSHDDIIQERAIICVCYKWEGDSKTHSIQWNDRGDDKELLTKFAKVIDSADEVVTQNGDAFDIKWLRARCIKHNIPISPKFNSIDTLKMAKAGFRFNSNKLDYMGQFLGEGKKIRTDYDLWKNITLYNDKASIAKMIEYCKEDVALLERIYNRLKPYAPLKKFKYKI